MFLIDKNKDDTETSERLKGNLANFEKEAVARIILFKSNADTHSQWIVVPLTRVM